LRSSAVTIGVPFGATSEATLLVGAVSCVRRRVARGDPRDEIKRTGGERGSAASKVRRDRARGCDGRGRTEGRVRVFASLDPDVTLIEIALSLSPGPMSNAAERAIGSVYSDPFNRGGGSESGSYECRLVGGGGRRGTHERTPGDGNPHDLLTPVGVG
jgi:hypothetical protein